MLDGVHLCASYLAADMTPEQVIVATEAVTNPEVLTIIQQLANDTDVIQVPQSLFSTISTVSRGAGVMFVIAIPDRPLEPLQQSALLLDTVQDPGNLGTMLRTAAAAGLRAVYVSLGSANPWSPKALRAGMGAQLVLDIYDEVDLASLVSASSVPVYATSLDAKRSIYDCDLRGDVAWLFGSEGQGVSAELLKLCGDNTVIIPQHPKVESLNVAAATAVCLFEQRRQLLAGG